MKAPAIGLKLCALQEEKVVDVLGFPAWLGALTSILGAVILAFVPYSLGRLLLTRFRTAGTYDLAASVLFRVGALHALILALVFATYNGLVL